MLTIIDRPSPNHDARPDGIIPDMLVLHYTDMQSAEAALERLCNPEAKVSAHYLIGKDGAVYRLVDESRRAWHAGISAWRGRNGINAWSIGIELDNPGHQYGPAPFPEAQMTALIALCQDICHRHPIPPEHIVAHSDIAPDRKTDPGEHFDWKRLARAGIGIWPSGIESTVLPLFAPSPAPEEIRRGQQALRDFGYTLEISEKLDTPTERVRDAWARRFAPEKLPV